MADPDSRRLAGEVRERSHRAAEARLVQRIAEQGPIPVSEYVDACLYDPDGGFYTRRGRAGGRSGHFLTAPEVGPLFGAVLARALDAWWAELGEPAPFTVIDWGAGPGTLARSVLAAEPRCMTAGALRWVAVELSPAQRALHPDHRLVTSAARVADVLAEGAGAGAAIANELLDNLPFDIVQRTESGWHELRVTVDAAASRTGSSDRDADGGCRGQSRRRSTRGGGGSSDRDACGGCRFSLVAAPASPALVEGLPDVAIGARVPVQRAARRWVAEAREVLEAGRIVAFDYGADTAALAERAAPAEDPASGLGWLRVHRSHDERGWWLADPGSCDITADVAFDQVQADHRADVCSQADFLRAHGIEELVAEGRAVWADRAALGDLRAMRARSRATEAEALLDPAGMGAFQVLAWPVGRSQPRRSSSRNI